MSFSTDRNNNVPSQLKQEELPDSQRNSNNLPYQSNYPIQNQMENLQPQQDAEDQEPNGNSGPQEQEIQDNDDDNDDNDDDDDDDENEDEYQMDNLTILMTNIKFFCFKLFTQEPVSPSILETSKPIILDQIRQFEQDANPSLHNKGFPNFENLFELILQDEEEFSGGQKLEQTSFIKNLNYFEGYIRQLYNERILQQPNQIGKQTGLSNQLDISSPKKTSKLKQKYLNKLNIIIQALWKQMWFIIDQDTYTIQRLDEYDIYKKNIEEEKPIKQQQSPNKIQELEEGHFNKQLINCNIEYSPKIFEWVQPPLQRQYVSEAAKVYAEVVPIRIKFICPSKISESPAINTTNYFNEEVDASKAVLLYPNPKTKKMTLYSLLDICKISTFQKQYAREIQHTSLKWVFSSEMKYTVIPDGRIFGIGCRTSKERIDPSMYEFTEEKISKRGQLPQAKRDFGMIYLKDCIYVIGGCNVNEPCSKKNYRYLIKQKKWQTIAESNYALRKPTVCVYGDRYIFKCGGINEFKYINKGIEMYDPETNAWCIVRSSTRSALDEVDILQDSLAVQINDDQIYVFGGKNSNQFQTDSGFVFNISEIRQRKKRAPKVSGQFWNVSIGLRNIYSYFGLFSQSNVVIHGNCIYALRKRFSNVII